MATGRNLSDLVRGRGPRLAGAAAVLLAALVAVPSLLADRPGGAATPAATPTQVTGPPPDGVPDTVVPWKGARLGERPGQLTVTVDAGGGAAGQPSDPCWEGYQPEARAEPGRVVVTVRRFRSRAALGPDQACAAIGLAWNVTVPLPGELGGRRLVDGATGKAMPVLRDLPAPLWLPPGWGLVNETAGQGERWMRVYGPKGDRPPGGRTPPGVELLERLTVVEIAPRLLGDWNRWPDTPRLGPTEVRGVRAEVDADPRDRNLNVRWREGDRGYVVTGQLRRGDPRGVEAAVVSFARSLRRPCEPRPAMVLDSWPQRFREAGGGSRPDGSRCR